MSDTDTSVSTTEFRGDVVDVDTKRPVEGANVALDETAFAETTDEAGEFVMTGVPVGEYTVRIKAEGYLEFKEPILIEDGPRAAERTFGIGASSAN
jgi:hypothetical protein